MLLLCFTQDGDTRKPHMYILLLIAFNHICIVEWEERKKHSTFLLKQMLLVMQRLAEMCRCHDDVRMMSWPCYGRGSIYCPFIPTVLWFLEQNLPPFYTVLSQEKMYWTRTSEHSTHLHHCK